MRVVLGNRKAITRRTITGKGAKATEEIEQHSGKRATVVDFPDGTTLAEAFTNVTHGQGVWAYHAAEGAKPAWVASDSPGLATLLAEHFGGIEVRDLGDPYQGRFGTVTGAVAKGTSALLGTSLAILATAYLLARVTPLLRTNAGADVQAQQMAGAASATAVLKWVALTANTTAPAATDTTLTGEIATASGGLIRKVGTYAHTTGVASYTLTTTFIANASDVLPVTIGKRGIFDAASAGNMGFETLISPTATLSAVGDQLTLTDTFNL